MPFVNFLPFFFKVEQLQQAINHISVLSPESNEAFVAAFEHWQVSKDHYLIREKQVADYIFFINKGIARIYYYKGGKEITEWIAMDGQFFLSITSFFQRTPSHLIIQTIEPAEVLGIHYNKLMELAKKYHDVETMFRKMLTGSLILSQQRMDSIQFETAQQRYEKLLHQFPDMVKRVPLSYIASFLGVTLETLSRIRSAR
ncbi:Crp/Fnr family transcriptional regulator [Lacibacter luteus]|uniref:Crp/Fnr family transcriptional regulator n=1 Tax=Lacibacter luteus TaxID=2508719 RepID=A0A4V1M848_9BACT|nr:Crp/Fnr family transcriptional regulator [Lacibacter luteus]